MKGQMVRGEESRAWWKTSSSTRRSRASCVVLRAANGTSAQIPASGVKVVRQTDAVEALIEQVISAGFVYNPVEKVVPRWQASMT